MASLAKRVPENVPGEFFVDSTCIDCDACRQIAPDVFGQAARSSFVHHQPGLGGRRTAFHALLSCPTGSIGCSGTDHPKEALGDFPLEVEAPVYYCGFNSPRSFGGNSYFIQRPDGNWLVDSPKFVAPLVKRLEARGGLTRIFLTHRDDVADADRFARHFNAQRIIDAREIDAQPDAEIVLEGNKPAHLGSDFVAIPTPGHSEGHRCLLFEGRYLFTGDHLYWDRDDRRLGAFRDYCWHSWTEQVDSMRLLLDYDFEWVLPGHGQRVRLSREEMSRQLRELVERMKSE
jgi:glyoxylase-like metal-dependent hydrolase (beta-lactamase superfamily II)/ferredoxin